MKLQFTFLLTATLSVSCPAAPVAGEYTVTDITGWTSNQLASLPAFRHYVPLRPPGASASFTPAARNNSGLVVGKVNDTGAYVAATGQAPIPSFGSYYWEYLYWDGDDWHFQNGFVEFSPATSVNDLGMIAGYSTLMSRGSNSYSYPSHAYLMEAATGTRTDITPDATRATALDISNRGTVVGSVAYEGPSVGYRRPRDGTMHLFSALGYTSGASAINEAGLVVGTYTSNAFRPRPFASAVGTNMVDMGLPEPADPDAAEVNDINIHGIAVGAAWRAATSYERQAVRWHRNVHGEWVATDLNEIRTTEGVLLEQAIAVNDAGHMIVRGRPDGSDAYGSRVFWLVPDVLTPVLPGPLAVTAEVSEHALRLEWPTATGFDYTLRATIDWTTWTPVTNVIGNGESAVVLDPLPNDTPRFYQVECVPQ